MEFLIKLIKKVQYNHSFVTIQLYNNNRFSPVFFPENKKSELLKLEGDTGGKIVIKSTPFINLISFSSEKEFFDIDTEEDYKKL